MTFIKNIQGARITGSITASFAGDGAGLTNVTASYVTTLNQNVIITGSLSVGTSSIGPNENTITLGARDTSAEGGQIGFNAPGGTYTSASFIDNWQNKARILKGNNTTSTGLIAQWDIHTTQMQLAGYTAASSFPGTATANLAVDSGGNVITVSTAGGTVFPYTGNATITGSLTVTQPIYVPINGGMYLQGGDDAALYDINVSNHMGIYGVQDSTIATIKLGSGGGTISGKSGNIGIGTINPTSASLTVNGNVWATSFTGSLLGTASYATQALSSSYAVTASYALNSVSSSYAQHASIALSSLNTSDILIYVKNVTGASIEKGKVVRISGATGDNALISTASYESDGVSANTLGILNETIANDSFGYAMTEGSLIGINTDTFTAGQLLFLGPTGSIIGYEPVPPLHAVRLGQALRIQQINGSMYVRIDNGYELDELHNVLIVSGSDGDLLVASGSNGNGKKLYINSRQLTGSYGLTGSLTVTGGITGSLFGTGSWAQNAVTASYVLNAVSSSYAATASYVNPLNQNVTISGSLGIGTINPLYDLDIVNGNSTFYTDLDDINGPTATVYSSDSTKRIRLAASIPGASISMGMVGSTATGSAAFGALNDSYLFSSALVNGLNIINSAGIGMQDYIRFYAGHNRLTTSTSHLHIHGSGSTKGFIGIGTETPNAKLDVSGSAIITGSLTVTQDITGSGLLITGSTTTDLVRITQTGTGNAFVVEDSTNPDATPFVISSSGNVGIGTTTPSAKFEIKSAAQNNLGGLLFSASGSTNYRALIYESSNSAGVIELYSGASLTTRLFGNGFSYFNGGNVGIGTTSPNAKLDINGNTLITGSLTVTNDLIVLGSASVQYITSSQLNINDNIISVNTITPAVRFGGLAVIDSGSSPIQSGSLLFDSQNNQWIFVHQSAPGAAVTSSMLLMGPQTFNNIGNETALTANRVPKASGADLGEHLTDSNIEDSGTAVSINVADAGYASSLFTAPSAISTAVEDISTGLYSGIYTEPNRISIGLYDAGDIAISSINISQSFVRITGSLDVKSGITGSLFGTASWAQNAVSASYADNVLFQPGSSGTASTIRRNGSNTATANYSLAIGLSNNASGIGSVAMGTANTASGDRAIALGRENIASGDRSFVSGYSNLASSPQSFAHGYINTASNAYSVAIGRQNTAAGTGSIALGYLNYLATGSYSFAAGQSNDITPSYAGAIGLGNIILENSGIAVGRQNQAGRYAFAAGLNNQATGISSFAIGQDNVVTANYAGAVGYQNSASGDYSYAEGFRTIAFGTYSHTEGALTTANGSVSHAEGSTTTASGNWSHAEGDKTFASASTSHAQGYKTITTGYASHAGGTESEARGISSFIHSSASLVTGNYSAVLGGRNITGSLDNTVYVPNLHVTGSITAPGIANAETSQVVYYNTSSGAMTYGEKRPVGNAQVDNFYYQISNSVDTRPIFEDDNVLFNWDETGNDLEFNMKVAPGGSGDMRASTYLYGGGVQSTAIVSTGVDYDLWAAGVAAGNRIEAFISAVNDVTYPAYRVIVFNTGESFLNTVWIERITRI